MKERIVYHTGAKRLYIMRGNSRVYHIAQRYIIEIKCFTFQRHFFNEVAPYGANKEMKTLTLMKTLLRS